MPTANGVVGLNVATPFVLREALPRVFSPSRKVTVPVGVVGRNRNVADTVAVRAIGCPKTEGLTDEVTAVCVLMDVNVKSTALAW